MTNAMKRELLALSATFFGATIACCSMMTWTVSETMKGPGWIVAAFIGALGPIVVARLCKGEIVLLSFGCSFVGSVFAAVCCMTCICFHEANFGWLAVMFVFCSAGSIYGCLRLGPNYRTPTKPDRRRH